MIRGHWSEWDASLPPQAAEDPSLRTGPRKLTIGMATYNDYSGVYFTVQAIRLYHPEVTRDTEILVIDNHPHGPASPLLQNLAYQVEAYRYVPNQTITGTAARDLVFREAATPCVLVTDCHVLFPPGVLRRLLDYFHSHPARRDLLQGPLLNDGLTRVSTHFTPTWNEGIYGQWATDERGVDPDGVPFEVPMQGLGVFACRREAWPGFNPRFRGFGGARRLHPRKVPPGRRTDAVPALSAVGASFWTPVRSPVSVHLGRPSAELPDWLDRARP